MRTIILIAVLIASVSCFAQNNLMETRNCLQRELQTSEATWMTRYNLAYVDIFITFGIKDESLKNRLLDEANTTLITLEAMKEADTSEVETLKAFRYLALMSMNPAVNGPKYAGSITATLDKALKQNAENPRAIILSAMFQKNMAGFMGKEYMDYGKDMQHAKALLRQQDSTRLAPTWGINMCGEK